MKTRSGKKEMPASTPTAFWDTSGVVPLCCYQAQTAQANMAARIHKKQIVWWATIVEAIGSLNRLVREGYLRPTESKQALQRLEYLRSRWHEIQPTGEVRDLAERLLTIHTLRAADALQLAAALVWCGNRPRGRYFIGADTGLSEAAEKEGFSAVRLRS